VQLITRSDETQAGDNDGPQRDVSQRPTGIGIFPRIPDLWVLKAPHASADSSVHGGWWRASVSREPASTNLLEGETVNPTMGGIGTSNPCRRRIFVVDEDLAADELTVREVSVDDSAAFEQRRHEAESLQEWLVEHHVCPCTPRSLAETSLSEKVAELARSNRELEQFAYVASHDLQEPLRMVAAYTQLLAERYRGRLDEKADQYLAYASEGALRMQSLIHDLLTFARIDRNGVARTAVDCDSVLQEVRLNLGSAIQDSGAEMIVRPLPVIWADRSQLVHLFQNLVGNAIKFRAQRVPSVFVEAEPQEEFWLFKVADNGIGIAPEYRENIFAVFQRLHTRLEYPGNGVGLAVCKKIVEHYGGRIWVESQVGQGSIFQFTLPACTACGSGRACP